MTLGCQKSMCVNYIKNEKIVDCLAKLEKILIAYSCSKIARIERSSCSFNAPQ